VVLALVADLQGLLWVGGLMFLMGLLKIGGRILVRD
jgi:hypothetical protein